MFTIDFSLDGHFVFVCDSCVCVCTVCVQYAYSVCVYSVYRVYSVYSVCLFVL